MFDELSQGLEKAWDMVRRDGKLSEDNIKEPMREIRRALLEADVSSLFMCFMVNACRTVWKAWLNTLAMCIAGLLTCCAQICQAS